MPQTQHGPARARARRSLPVARGPPPGRGRSNTRPQREVCLLKQASRPVLLLVAGLALAVGILSSPVAAQEGPAVLDPDLRVRTVVSGLVTPSTMAFLGPNDFLIAEKSPGQVNRVVKGVGKGTVLDFAVNNAPEGGLLGMGLH